MKSFSPNQLFILLAAVTIALFALVTIEETWPRPAAPAPGLTPPAAELAPEPEPQDEFANWKVLSDSTWELKYPPSRYDDCEVGDAIGICLIEGTNTPTVYYQRPDLVIVTTGYSSIGELNCGKTYDECLKTYRNILTTIDYQKERVAGDFSGTELLRRNNDGLSYKKLFIVAVESTNSRGTVVVIEQNRRNQTIDNIYEKILSTFRFLE